MFSGDIQMTLFAKKKKRVVSIIFGRKVIQNGWLASNKCDEDFLYEWYASFALCFNMAYEQNELNFKQQSC